MRSASSRERDDGSSGTDAGDVPREEGKRTSDGRKPAYQRRGGGYAGPQRARRPFDGCFFCKSMDHYARDCPKQPNNDAETKNTEESIDKGAVRVLETDRVVNTEARSRPTTSNSAESGQSHSSRACTDDECLVHKTFVELRWGKRKVRALLDTGSAKNVAPTFLFAASDLKPTTEVLYTASGQALRVDGEIDLEFKIQGVNCTAHFLVTNAIDEMILGFGFILRNDGVWFARKGEMHLRGHPIRLIKKPARLFVRRLYSRSIVCVPPNCNVLIPARVTVDSRELATGTVNTAREPSDWLVESKSLHGGVVFTAHSLIPADGQFAAVSVLNIGDRNFYVKEDSFLGGASEALYITDLPEDPREILMTETEDDPLLSQQSPEEEIAMTGTNPAETRASPEVRHEVPSQFDATLSTHTVSSSRATQDMRRTKDTR